VSSLKYDKSHLKNYISQH